MGFHENLLQTFQNFKNVFIGSTDISTIGDGKITGAISALNTNKQEQLSAGTNITIETAYYYSNISTSCSIVEDYEHLPETGTENINYILEDSDDVYTWDDDNSEYVLSPTLSSSFVASLPSIGVENILYVLTSDNTVYSCEVILNTISAKNYDTDINSLSQLGSAHTSELSSLSSSLSQAQSNIYSLSDENSNQNSLLSSASTELSEHATNISSLTAEMVMTSSTANTALSKVNNKQDTLVAGLNITIVEHSIYTEITSSVVLVTNPSSLPAEGNPLYMYISRSNGEVYNWVNNNYVLSSAYTASFVSSKPSVGSTSVVYVLSSDDSCWTCEPGALISSTGGGVKIEVVQTLPVTDIDTHTIYLVPKQTAGTDDVYDEYIYVNNAWECIGSTRVDLTNYYTKTEVNSMFTSASTSQSAVDSTQNASINSLTSENSTQTSEIASLSISASEIASVASSLSQEQSTQAVSIGSLSTDTSELGSEMTILTSEVADKQDVLTAGDNIDITNNVISATGGTALEWQVLMPSASNGGE